jgi:hypothetical protein
MIASWKNNQEKSKEKDTLKFKNDREGNVSLLVAEK